MVMRILFTDDLRHLVYRIDRRNASFVNNVHRGFRPLARVGFIFFFFQNVAGVRPNFVAKLVILVDSCYLFIFFIIRVIIDLRREQ